MIYLNLQTQKKRLHDYKRETESLLNPDRVKIIVISVRDHLIFKYLRLLAGIKKSSNIY